ncbi:MAG: hypothetical protein ACLTYN_17200 [Dysosmobacter welbionis]
MAEQGRQRPLRPGSVFKLITCAAALDTGAIGKHSSFYCSAHR